MKKLLSLLLALAMMLSTVFVLVSCGEEEPPEETPPVTDDSTPDDDDDEETEKVYNVSWTEEQTINIKLNLVEGQYVNMLKRYMSGNDDRYSSRVDEMILERNAAATTATKVKANYLYWLSTDENCGWGKSDDTIVADKDSFDAAASPDVYVTAAFDTCSATVKGALANLVGKTRDNGQNYFTFLESEYDADENDKGYYYEMMRSFSPIPDSAMFTLVSDYTTDAFRALHVIPVSITLLQGMNVADAVSKNGVTNFDKNGNNTFEMEELVEFVEEKKWTWDVMASLCAAVYKPSGTATDESFADTVFGFYMDIYGGSSANALTYSTTFKHWDKTYDADGVPTYTQKDASAFQSFADAMTRFFNTKGVMRVDKAAIADSGMTSLETPCDAIAERFGRNEVLFGENVLVGYIESNYYQDMEGSFGLVPQPLTTVPTNVDEVEYTTALGNAARVLSFGVNTDDFAEATAFVDYQSTHSDEILKQYFKSQQYESTNGEDYNIRMLTYLRGIMVDQEAQFMNLYTWGMGCNTDTLAAKIPAPEGGYLTFTAQDHLNHITRTWKNSPDPSSELTSQYYTVQYSNTMTSLYKLVVDEFVKYSKSN